MSINIKGLSKARILAALYNNARAVGMGVFQDIKRGGVPMSEVEAEDLLGKCKYFDYVYGRPLKVAFTSDELDGRLYDRDHGQGACERIVKKVAEGTDRDHPLYNRLPNG